MMTLGQVHLMFAQWVLLAVMSWSLISEAVRCDAPLMHLMRVAVLALSTVSPSAVSSAVACIFEDILLDAVLIHAIVWPHHLTSLIAIAVEHVIIILLVKGLNGLIWCSHGSLSHLLGLAIRVVLIFGTKCL